MASERPEPTAGTGRTPGATRLSYSRDAPGREPHARAPGYQPCAPSAGAERSGTARAAPRTAIPWRGDAECIRLQSGTGSDAQGCRHWRTRTHFPSSSAALRRRAAALALTAACSHLPSGSFVGFSASAPNFNSFSREEPCRGMFAHVRAETRVGQPAVNTDAFAR